MKMLAGILQELLGLFVDDGSLALAVCGVVAIAAAVSFVATGFPLAAGAVLVVGCATALFENVMRAARKKV